MGEALVRDRMLVAILNRETRVGDVVAVGDDVLTLSKVSAGIVPNVIVASKAVMAFRNVRVTLSREGFASSFIMLATRITEI